ncbi:M48 family metallopeptidase [Marinobacter sp. MDS2]|uniref:M48 family metallopeptidase n=1 Tax=Marinobacter sp. MDS2 TaxID=3065961 RepID=UPI00273AC108|nr:M48 family metallopeptidase [Marinobacter sp. MDS2]MDP4548676.1 M48 family metallopeptidase [Marinobacter sp. MDS2]
MAAPGFFQRQAHARRNTTLLVVLFLTAVVLITLAVCLVGYLVTRSESSPLPFHHWLLSSHGITTAAAVVVLIGIGSLVRWADLAGGGSRVAKMVGARLIDPDTRDPDERKLRNIVEEMAIASGVSVPELYVMDGETSINAFVAGYSPGEAVMVVTKGALSQLDRDELQGVVGHEFSHILNGDMRLNVRLIAILAGILMIGQIGQFLLRVGFYSSATRSRNSDNRAQFAMGVLGLVLMIIGYVGVFFGRLIQAAVSRQREMLADASSVQFTRNPEGIGGALFKIGMTSGYLDTTSHASDMNHMCFGESARMKFSSLLASHPPVNERINAIQPGLLARLRSRLRDTEPSAKLQTNTPQPETVRFADLANQVTGPARGTPGARLSPLRSSFNETAPQPASQLSSRVGTVTPKSEAFAADLLQQLPATFRNLLYTRAGAIQLCYGLLTYHLPANERERCLALLPEHTLLGEQRDILTKLNPTLIALGEAARFPILELAMPALRKLDSDERRLLLNNVRKLVAADKRLSLFELALNTFLSRHLAPNAEQAVPVRHRNYRSVRADIECVVGLFARAGSPSEQDAAKLYQEAIAGFFSQPNQPPTPSVSIKELQAALASLSRLSPLLKPGIIDACGHCILHDGKVEVREYELMRLVADQLDCPMPPL